jgi:hypothetical protein
MFDLLRKQEASRQRLMGENNFLMDFGNIE